MATKTQYGRIALLSKNKTDWVGTTVLLKGEMGIETDTGLFKLGDGTSTWSELPYASGEVIDNLTTEDATKALSAKQGKVLKGQIDTHIADKANPHEVTKSQVGLGNVDNTSDADKPISTATQVALDLKAPLASPAFTGNPTAPTQANNDNSTKIATTAFVNNAVAGVTGAMVYKGTVASASQLPTTDVRQGWVYIASASFTLGTEVLEAGDMIIAKDTTPTWSVVQTNINGAVTGPTSSTDGHVATFDGGTGKKIKDSGYTIGQNVPASNSVGGYVIGTDATSSTHGLMTSAEKTKVGHTVDPTEDIVLFSCSLDTTVPQD